MIQDSKIRVHPAIDAQKNPPCWFEMKMQRHTGRNFSKPLAIEIIASRDDHHNDNSVPPPQAA